MIHELHSPVFFSDAKKQDIVSVSRWPALTVRHNLSNRLARGIGRPFAQHSVNHHARLDDLVNGHAEILPRVLVHGQRGVRQQDHLPRRDHVTDIFPVRRHRGLLIQAQHVGSKRRWTIFCWSGTISGQHGDGFDEGVEHGPLGVRGVEGLIVLLDYITDIVAEIIVVRALAVHALGLLEVAWPSAVDVNFHGYGRLEFF